MAERQEYGWVKLHRSFFGHPVWSKPPHVARVFLWLVAAAAPFPRLDRSFGRRPAAVERGQVVTSYSEITASVGHMTRKQARGALEYLEREGMITRCEVEGLPCTLVTIVNYGQYQDKTLPIEGDEGAGDEQNGGHSTGHSEGHNEGHSDEDGYPLTDSGNGEIDTAIGHSEGHSMGHTGGHPINKDQEVKELINPPTPFKKGGRLPSVALTPHQKSTAVAILALWRQECAAAGRPLAEGIYSRRDIRAAKKLTVEYVGVAGMSLDMIQTGVRELVRLIVTDSRCARYDLCTFAKDPVKFGVRPLTHTATPKQAVWSFVCDVCRSGKDVTLPRRPPPANQPCVEAESGCQGMMRATFLREI